MFIRSCLKTLGVTVVCGKIRICDIGKVVEATEMVLQTEEYLQKVCKKMGWEFKDERILVPKQGNNDQLAAKYGMDAQVRDNQLAVNPLKFYSKDLTFPKNRKEIEKIIDLIAAMQKRTAPPAAS